MDVSIEAEQVSDGDLFFGVLGYLYYAEGDVIHKYLVDNDALIDLAEQRLTRTFTADECARYRIGSDRCPAPADAAG